MINLKIEKGCTIEEVRLGSFKIPFIYVRDIEGFLVGVYMMDPIEGSIEVVETSYG